MVTKDLLRLVIYELRVFAKDFDVRRSVAQTEIDAEGIIVISGIRRCEKSILITS